MKKIITLLCLVSTILVSSITKVNASHAVGADLTYTYVSANVIHIKLRFYRDCSGIPAPLTAAIDISSVSCGIIQPTVNLPLISSTQIVTSDCIDTSQATTCNGGPRYGVEEYIYEGDVTLPQGCTDWIFEFEECCRNTNQTMSGGPYLYVSTSLDNLNYPTNSSPQFLSYPATSFCVGNPFYYKQEAFDPDGDSLVYSLVDAQTNGGALVNYIFPYSGIYPVASSTPITIDQTGQIFLTPSQIQTAVMCVQVEEYRNGIKIGAVKRDIQIKVESLCDPNLIPKYDALADSVGVNVPCGTFAFDVPFKRDVQCGSIVNDDFRVINSLGFPIPIISITGYNCAGGLTDSIRIVLSEPFTYGSNYVWTKTGSDGNTILGKCGFGAFTFDTIEYIVNDPSPYQLVSDSVGCVLNSFTTDLSEYVYCYSVDQDGSSLQLIDAGNGNNPLPIVSTYTYCGPSGDSLSNQILINFPAQQTPAGPLYLIVKTGTDNNTIANSCGRFLNVGDTLAVYYIDNVIPTSLGGDLDACTNNNEIPVALNSGYTSAGGLTFQWYLNGGAISGETNATYSAAATGSYSVIVSATAFCKGTDTIDINVINVPVIDLGPALRDICRGDSILLDMGAGSTNYLWYYNQQNTATGQTLYANLDGQYVGAIVTVGPNPINHLCFSSDTVVLVNHDYPVLVLSDQTVCSSTLPFVIDAGNSGASYQWSNGATQQTVSTSTAGPYSVTITNFPSCAVNDSMYLTVLISPTANLPIGIAQCTSDPAPTLDPGFTGAQSYLWTDGSGATVSTDSVFTPPVTAGTNTYTVVITNGPCTATDQTVFTVNSAPTLNALGTQAICEIDPAAVLDANYSGATVTYLWSTGATTQTISASTTNDYIVTVTENGCVSKDTVTLTVQQQLAAPVIACGGGSSSSYLFVYTWNDIVGNTGYEVSTDKTTWIPANTPSGPTSHGSNETAPTFYVRTKMNGGCLFGKTSDPIACAPVVPNIITPNGDGQNDVLLIENIGFYPNNVMKIFNRWGKEVYNEGGYNNTTKVFKGDNLAEGTYFYILELGNGTDPKSGTLTIAIGK